MPRGVADPNRANRCVAVRHGERCKKSAIKGGTVCPSHGGAAPQVQRSARERYNDAIDPMINTSLRYIKEAEEGKLDPMVALAWAKFVADRTGFVPGKTVNIDGPAKWEVALTHIIKPASEEVMLELEATVVEDEDLVAERELARIAENERQARADADRRKDALTRAGIIEMNRHARPVTDNVRTTVDPPRR